MERPAPPPLSGPSWLLWLLAIALLGVANGRWHLAPAAWLAPVFVLLFVESQPPGRGLAFAFLAQLLAFFVSWRGMIPVPGLWYYLVAGIYAAVYFLPFVLHRLLARRFAGFRSTFVLPVSWVAIELVFQKLVTPYGSWASLAYTQVGFLPLIQLASVTGLSGIHFVMLWSAAVVSWAWRQGRPFSRVRAGVVTWSAVLLALLLWGQWRIASPREEAPLLRVAALTPAAALDRQLQTELESLEKRPAVDEPSMVLASEIAERLNADLLERTRRAAEAGADLVVWSEHAARVTRRSEARLIERAQLLARSTGVPLILGIGLWDPESRPAFENKAVAIDAQGTLRGVYHKARPIVGEEARLIAKGNSGIGTLETPRGRFGIVICHDLDFPDFLREAGRRGVVALFAPSSDWDAITPFHARMAVARAVENGCSLVRPCSNGLSLAVDPLGRTLASQLDHGDDGNRLVANVPLFRSQTSYPIIGDSFAYANLGVFTWFLAARFRARARRLRRGASA